MEEKTKRLTTKNELINEQLKQLKEDYNDEIYDKSEYKAMYKELINKLQ